MFDFIKKLFGKKEEKQFELSPAAELLQLAVDISTNTVHDVFVDYWPHVKCIDVRIHIDGWIEGQTAHKDFYISMDRPADFKKCMDYLNELKDNGFF